ncbi:putative leucine-rich repeat receptor-like protein kinase IMK3 [Bidens hawaiensis]|uniref:putative leucine-rich repeat receptor-like protein kinase IMK3 n=1 Tax=Bidens hawaiensis TaxID=980011 RepID=UPI004049614D
MWKHSYLHKKLDQIIFKDIIPTMDPTSLKTFSDIAFQCLHDSREQRPTMSLLVKKFHTALKFQEHHEMKLDDAMGTSQTYMNKLFSKGKGLFLGKKKKEMAIQKTGEDNGARKPEGKLIHFDDTLLFTADEILNGSGELMGCSTYGRYYKGTLYNGKRVAANKLGGNFTKNQTEVEVEAELRMLANIRHPNLLTMRAYYILPEGEKILIYDYPPKGNIATFLHPLGPKQPINWETRMQIVKGMARGLQSVHIGHNIIHGNLTSSNVFLDEDINPKISDFGLSQLLTPATYSSLSLVAGVLGYQAPELSTLEKADMKTDIYSLGVIMLEILTGKSPRQMKDQDLPQWVRSITQQEWTSEVFDVSLMREHTSLEEEEEMFKVLHLAMDCVYELPLNRPDAHLVLQQLEQIRSETATSSSNDGNAS